MTVTIADYNMVAAGLTPVQTTELGSGLTGPVMRCYGHLLYTLAATADAGYTIPPEEAVVELQHALHHLNATHTDDNMTRGLRRDLQILKDSLGVLSEGYIGWNDDDRKIAIADLAHRFAGFAATLDYEFIGLTTASADAGISI